MARAYAKWSEEEDEILRDLYRRYKTEEITEKLPGRSPHAVKMRAEALNIVGRKLSTPWTLDDDEKLRVIWPIYPEEARQHFPKHKFYRIIQRARDLGIAPAREDKARTVFRHVSLDTLENAIVKPGIEKHLVPLLHFRGAANLGRMHRYWNFVISMKEHECESIREGINLHMNSAHAQLCMPERRFQNSTMYSFLSRLQLKPEVTNNVPGLLDYARMLFPHPYSLTPVSPFVYDHPGRAAWWRKAGVRQRKIDPFARDGGRRVSDVRYPFLIHEPKESSEHELLTLVDRAVPKGLPEQFRADICQDLIVALLTGDITKDEVKGSVQDFTRKMFKMFPTKYGALSLDAPAPWMDDGRTLAETLSVGEVY